MTAGAGGFVDITARGKADRLLGLFQRGRPDGDRRRPARIEKEGKVRKLVKEVEQVSFSGRRGVMQGQDVTYVTERCVLKLTPEGIVLTEIAPAWSCSQYPRPGRIPVDRPPALKQMEAGLFPA